MTVSKAAAFTPAQSWQARGKKKNNCICHRFTHQTSRRELGKQMASAVQNGIAARI